MWSLRGNSVSNDASIARSSVTRSGQGLDKRSDILNQRQLWASAGSNQVHPPRGLSLGVVFFILIGGFEGAHGLVAARCYLARHWQSQVATAAILCLVQSILSAIYAMCHGLISLGAANSHFLCRCDCQHSPAACVGLPALTSTRYCAGVHQQRTDAIHK